MNAQQAKQSKKDNFVKGIANYFLCSTGCRSSNTDYVAYDQLPSTPAPMPAINSDQLDKLLPSNVKTQSRSRVGIIVDASPRLIERRVKPIRILTAQKAQANLVDHFTLANNPHILERQQLNDRPDCTYEFRAPNQWHSTQIDADVSDLTRVSKLTSTPKKPNQPRLEPRISSIGTQKPDWSSYESTASSTEFSSQLVTSSSSDATSTCSSFSDDTATSTRPGAAQQPSMHVYNIREARANRVVAHKGAIYACCRPYSAARDGDLNVKFADLVKFVSESGDCALVQLVQTGEFGYVPLDCLKPIENFIGEIKISH